MNTKTIAAIAALLVVLAAGYAFARPANGGFWNGMMGYGSGNGPGYGMMGSGGMMGGNGTRNGPGYGITGSGGMMGGAGNGYCGANAGGYGVNATPITIEKAKGSVDQYLASTGNADLNLTEVIEFENNFYAGIKEKSTGKHAFELLVNKYTGAVMPEPGPNMMWNTKYGHMTWNTTSQTAITEKQALEYARAYLDSALPGTKTGDADAYYGYYTIEVTNNNRISGMLSVNSYTGAVWYHSWHGDFVKILEVE
ncbi:Uncharacterised protein [uncultured archaeon]|nr:Uncharacterised protein [uncultured archaeon]